MSLHFFFNSKGPLVRTLLTLGWTGTLYWLFRFFQGSVPWNSGSQFFFILYIIEISFISFVGFFPWYQPEDRGHGIEDHFSKIMVPIAYILTVSTSLLFLLHQPWLYFLCLQFFFIPIASIHGILIFFHFKDHDPLAPSYFSRSLYLKNK